MQQSAYADTILLSTPCLADCTIVLRDGTPRRLLQWIWSVGAGRLVDGVRGTVWICHSWLAEHLGVTRGTLRSALTRLRHAGWIRDAITSDQDGHPHRGLVFANAAEAGFGNAGRTLDVQTAYGPRTLDAPPPTLKLKEVQSMPAQSGGPRDPRQSSLLGASFDAPAKQHKPEDGKMGTIKRDPRLHDVAVRVDDYERLRYDQHPRRVRSKRDTPEARSIAVEAITLALERVVASGLYETLDAIEERFRGVVELNWEGAERKLETWEWWTGSALWAPNSLERCLGWLDEERNWVFIERAEVRAPLTTRPNSESAGRTEGLSPAEQQAEYDARHGIASGMVWDESRIDISVEGQILPGGKMEIGKIDVTPSLASSYGRTLEGTARVDEDGRLSIDIEYRDGKTEEDMREIHRVAAKAMGLVSGPQPIVPWTNPLESGPLRNALDDALRANGLPDLDDIETACDDSKWAPPKTGEEIMADVHAMMSYEHPRLEAEQTSHARPYSTLDGNSVPYEPSKVTMSIGGHEITGPAGSKPATIVELIGLDEHRPKGPKPPIHRLPPAPFLSVPGFSVEPPIKTEDELRRVQRDKEIYLCSTTPEERDADAKAGRKPWEVR